MKSMGNYFIVFATFSAGIISAANLNRPAAQAATTEEKGAAAVMPVGKTVEIKAPLGLPPVPIPADNPPTADTIALGRRLYYDPILSADGTISCASCHSPEAGFTDRNSVSLGVGGKRGHGTRRQ